MFEGRPWTSADSLWRSRATGRLLLVLGMALVLQLVAVPSGEAQDRDADPSVALLLDLQRLQLANLDMARLLADVEMRSAALLQAAIADGKIANAAERRLADALIANATILAAMAMSPDIGDDGVAAFESVLERNRQLVGEVRQMAGNGAGFRAALDQYESLQVQAYDLSNALRDSRSRYRSVVAEAQARSALPAGSFDPETETWSLQLPATLPAVGAVTTPMLEEGGAAAAAAPASPAERPSTQRLAGTPEPASAAPPIEPAIAALAPEIPSASNPEPAIAVPELPPLELPALDRAATAPPALPDDRLPAGQNLEVAAADAAPPPRGGAWTVAIDAGNRPVAVAASLDPAPSGIEGLRIGCSPNGTLRYTFVGEPAAAEYYVAVDEARGQTVRAEAGVVRGSEAIRMSDALRLAFETATGGGRSGGHIAVALDDQRDRPAQLPVLGYLEARGRVLDGCAPYPEAEDVEPVAPPATAAVVDGPLVLSPEAAGAPDAPTPSSTDSSARSESSVSAEPPVAPIPAPPLDRQSPVDLMGRT